MAYTVEENKSVRKEVAKLQSKVKSNYNKWKTNDLVHHPETAHEGTVNKFKEATVYKKRFGQHRALYIINKTNQAVLIFQLDGRDDVYK